MCATMNAFNTRRDKLVKRNEEEKKNEFIRIYF